MALLHDTGEARVNDLHRLGRAYVPWSGVEEKVVVDQTRALPEWEKSFLEASANPKIEKRVAAPRLGYYKLACQSILESETPQAAVWPLLLTWTISACVLPGAGRAAWSSACGRWRSSAPGAPRSSSCT